MPYPAQVHREDLISAARRLIEQDGLDQLTLQAVAETADIATPSLYHHFRNKSALIAAVSAFAVDELIELMRQTSDAVRASTPDAREGAAAMLRAYRDYALANPATYSLMFASTNPEYKPDPQTAEALALPLQAIMADIVGPARSLDALRGGWALAHGFVMLEITGQFQRGGSLDAAYEAAIGTFIRGLPAG